MKSILLLSQIDTQGGNWDELERRHYLTLYRTWKDGGDFASPLASFPSMTNVVFNPSASVIAGIRTTDKIATLYDVDTCADIVRLCPNAQSNSRHYQYPNVVFGIGELGENVVASNGCLFDIRTASVIHQFDRLSTCGNFCFHPSGNSVLLDNSLWDLRNFRLVSTTPVADLAVSRFSPDGDVLFSYHPYRKSDLDRDLWYL